MPAELSFNYLSKTYLVFRHVGQDTSIAILTIDLMCRKGGTQKGVGHFFLFRSPFRTHFVTLLLPFLLTFLPIPFCLPPKAPFCGRVIDGAGTTPIPQNEETQTKTQTMENLNRQTAKAQKNRKRERETQTMVRVSSPAKRRPWSELIINC